MFFSQSVRCFSTFGVKIPKICIVGAGPAGFYSAQHILKNIKKKIEIDIIEKLPVPFGLVRFGVAPDHPEVKNVINTFTKTAENPQVNYMGNIAVGEDVAVEELLKAYDIVLLSYGAYLNRNLNIPGENLANVIPARRVVGWYNGIPEDVDLKIDLSGKKVAIIGQGNVAIDIARILLKPIDYLKSTDITNHALKALAKSNVKEVYLIGRRGPLQAAFTIKELREMLKLHKCQTVWNKEDFRLLLENNNDLLDNLDRPRKRLTELMLKSVNSNSSPYQDDFKRFLPIFFRSPLEIKNDNHNNNKKIITLGINKLEETDDKKIKAVLTTSNKEKLECDLIISSIGYKAIRIDDKLPFNNSKGILINDKGKITKGLYATGWVATGPVGVILNTMSDAFRIAETICKDLETVTDQNKPGFSYLKDRLKGRQIVTWNDWLNIDKYEMERGKIKGKPREKIVDYKEILKMAA